MQLYQKNFEENSFVSIITHIFLIFILFFVTSKGLYDIIFSYLSISIIAFILTLRIYSLYKQNRLIGCSAIILTSVWWASIFAIEVMNTKELTQPIIVSLLIILGITSGGAFGFIKKIKLVYIHIGILLIPTATSLYFFLPENEYIFSFMVIIYGLFHVMYALKQNKMWEELLKNKLKLEFQAKVLNEKRNQLKKSNYVLDQALLKAETASKVKSEFLSNISHEIRTPLNGIIGASEILKDTELNKKQKKFIKILEYSSSNLLNTVNDILDFTRISERKIQLLETSIGFKDFIHDIIDYYKTEAEEKNIEIITKISNKIEEEIIVDEIRLKQIIVNILSNAIKFTIKGQVFININLQQDTKDNQIIHFSIEDTGIGIPKEKLDEIFESFTQAYGALDRKYGGAGLGVTISKMLVELMGGTIDVISPNPNITYLEYPGTIFSFDIQVRKNKKYKKPKTKIKFPKIKALIIDDNDTNIMVLAEILKNMNIKNSSIKNKEEILEIIKSKKINNYDLVIIDYKMPEIDGLEVLKLLKVSKTNKNQKYMLLSSASLNLKEDEFIRNGFDSILMKPIKEDTLRKILVNIYIKKQKLSIPHININHKTIPELKILIVEDNIINQKVFSSILKQIGYKCKIANNGKEALSILEDKSINLVFMDIQMPIKDGYETVTEMRYSKDNRIVIAVTANTMENDEIKCFASGMNDYIPKPFNKEQIIDMLNKWGKNAIKTKHENL